MELEKVSAIKDDDYNFLKMMQLTDKNYNKIRKINKQQLSHNSKNLRQSEINGQIQILYDEIDKEFNILKANNFSSSCFKHKIIKINKDNTVLQSSLFKSIYVPTKIANYIKEHAKIVVEYNCELGNGKNVTVKFILFDSSHYELNNIRKKGASYFKHCMLKIYIWLKVLSKYSSVECGKNLECFIYLTPFKRKLPSCSGFETSTNMYHYTDSPENENDNEDNNDNDNDNDNENMNGAGDKNDRVIGASHVNGGLSNICQIDGRILVYRKEEWFKVLIHESMHNYGMDFSDIDLLMANKKLHSIFSIQTDIKIFESYCETWARVMNVFFESYFEMNRHSRTLFTPLTTRKKFIHKQHKEHKQHFVSLKIGHGHGNVDKGVVDKKQRFLNTFYDNIQHESVFSIFQCVKVLNFMGLDYNIISNCNYENYSIVKKLYKEQTNVFAYYIIVAILIGNFNNFILWCIDNNTNLFNFKKTNAAIESFVIFISKNYKNNELLNMIVSLEKRLENRRPNDKLLLSTMRMSVIGGNK
jgi:hypothetical protein